jgi:hypothetical protein
MFDDSNDDDGDDDDPCLLLLNVDIRTHIVSALIRSG